MDVLRKTGWSRLVLLLSIAIFASMVMVACSEGDGDEETEPLKIGYLADFSGPHARLAAHGLITEESDQHQYRFQEIIDPASGETVFEIEHEVRSLRHPLYARPLVNRNPAQRIMGYRPGHDAVMVG